MLRNDRARSDDRSDGFASRFKSNQYELNIGCLFMMRLNIVNACSAVGLPFAFSRVITSARGSRKERFS
jgi:hypothetical protein